MRVRIAIVFVRPVASPEFWFRCCCGVLGEGLELLLSYEEENTMGLFMLS